MAQQSPQARVPSPAVAELVLLVCAHGISGDEASTWVVILSSKQIVPSAPIYEGLTLRRPSTPKSSVRGATFHSEYGVRFARPWRSASKCLVCTARRGTAILKKRHRDSPSSSARQTAIHGQRRSGAVCEAFIAFEPGRGTATILCSDNVDGAWSKRRYVSNGVTTGAGFYCIIRPRSLTVTVTPRVDVYMSSVLQEYRVRSPAGVTLDATASNTGTVRQSPKALVPSQAPANGTGWFRDTASVR